MKNAVYLEPKWWAQVWAEVLPVLARELATLGAAEAKLWQKRCALPSELEAGIRVELAMRVNRAMHTQKKSGLHEVLPKAGLVVSEKGNLTEILCKPKILPLKSITLQKLEEMEVGTASACMQLPVRPLQHTFSRHALHQHVRC